jgi:hypothetical protein
VVINFMTSMFVGVRNNQERQCLFVINSIEVQYTNQRDLIIVIENKLNA